MSAKRGHRNERDDPDPPRKKFRAETHPEFLDANVDFLRHCLNKRCKTEPADTGGRPAGPPQSTTDSTLTNPPVVHQEKEPTPRAKYGTARMRAGEAWNWIRHGKHVPRPTVERVKIEREDTDGSVSPSTSYDSPPHVKRERDDTFAKTAMPMPSYTLAASGVAPASPRTSTTTGEALTRVDRVYVPNHPAFQSEATRHLTPLQKFAHHTHHHTHYHTTHNPTPAFIVLPVTAFRVQGGSGQDNKNDHSGINNVSSPGMRYRHLRPTSPTSVHLIRSTERRSSGRRAGTARRQPLCTCPQEGGSKKDCPHSRPARRSELEELYADPHWQTY